MLIVIDVCSYVFSLFFFRLAYARFKGRLMDVREPALQENEEEEDAHQ